VTVISIEQFRQEMDRYLTDAAASDLVLTREGKPCYLLRAIHEGANGADEYPAEFWTMIRQRRQEKGIAWKEAKKLLDLDA
jgi:hypothetical protein